MHDINEYVEIQLPGHDNLITFFSRDFSLVMYTGTKIILFINDIANNSTIYTSSNITRIEVNNWFAGLVNKLTNNANCESINHTTTDLCGIHFNDEIILIFDSKKMFYYDCWYNNNDEKLYIKLKFSNNGCICYLFEKLKESQPEFERIFQNFGVKHK